MKIIFAGTPHVARQALEALNESSHHVVGVLTRPPAPVGRKRILTPSPVHEYALEHGIDVRTPVRLSQKSLHEEGTSQEELAQWIRHSGAQAIIVVAYGVIIPSALLEVTPVGWLNLHFSLLPQWRGAAPVQYAIASGQKKTGMTIFRIGNGLDTGNILAQRTYMLDEESTSGQVLEQMAHIGGDFLIRTLDEIETRFTNGEDISGTAQNGQVSLAPAFSSAHAQIDWRGSMRQIRDHIRAVSPAPGAFTFIEGMRVKIGPVLMRSQIHDLEPGLIRGTYVGCGDGALELTSIAPAGKKWMQAEDWARGVRTQSLQCDNPTEPVWLTEYMGEEEK